MFFIEKALFRLTFSAQINNPFVAVCVYTHIVVQECQRGLMWRHFNVRGWLPQDCKSVSCPGAGSRNLRVQFGPTAFTDCCAAGPRLQVLEIKNDQL